MSQNNTANSYLLPISLLLLAIVKLTSTNSSLLKLRQDCDEISKTSKCRCTQLYDFEITCTTGEIGPFFTARIRHNDHVQIDCHNTDPKDFTLLPKMSIGSVPTVVINQCSLPQMQPIQIILERLGITEVKALLYENGQLGGSLQRIHFMGLQNIIHLKLSSNGITTLPEDLFEDLTNLTRLDLRSNKIQLHRNTFAALENLHFLELGRNSLQDLPPGIFRNQKNLNQLNLWSNNLTNLNKKSFEGASSLSELDLSANNIVTLRPDVFSLLPNLKSINLDANYIQSLPVGIFAKNKNLMQFRLNNNRVPMKQLPAGLLSNLPVLRVLRLSCGLEIVPDDTFAGSTAIRNLTISGNNLTFLPYMLFADQKNLIDLDLSRNRLTTLPDDIFQNTRNLIALRLSHNRLENVSSLIFASLTNLEFLYLDNNNLRNIENNSFNFNRKLIYITMENNYVSFYDSVAGPLEKFEINSPFRYLSELKILNLRNNSIGNIFRDWKLSLLNLRILDLSYNHIANIRTEDLLYRSKQILVDLTHNHIQRIDFSIVNIVIRKEQKILITIGHNPIVCDCKLFPFVQFLNGKVGQDLKGILKVSTDNLQCSSPQSLKDYLVGKVSPEGLICPLIDEYNSEKQCPVGCSCWARSFDSTVIVNCSNGEFIKIPSLPRSWPVFWNRTELYVENNKLKELPSAKTPGYSLVNQLYAANNSLTKISIDNMPKYIDFLDVSHNELEALNSTLLQAFNESRTKIALSHNPWLCDCTMQNLVLFAQTKYELIPDLEDMQCANGVKFQKLSLESICPIRHGLMIGVSILISAICLCIGLLAALYYKYQQEFKVWLYAHNLCLWFVTEEELDKDKKYDAFISYSHKDANFVENYLQPELENGPTPFKLCLHIRDWIIGELIPNQIVRSVDDSRRTIIVLSPNFIESVWAQMEFRAAHTASLNEGRTRVIVIIYGDIGNIDTLDPELKAYLQMNTYVKWGDPWFWNKLRYAMPHPSHNRSRLVNTTNQGIIPVDSKLELTMSTQFNPPNTTPPAEATKKDLLLPHAKPVTNGDLPKGHINGAYINNSNSLPIDI